METLREKFYVIVFCGVIILLVSSCAPPPLEVFFSPNPDFNQPQSQPQSSQQTSVSIQPLATPAPTIVVEPSEGVDDDKIKNVLSDSVAKAQALVSSGEARLQEQNIVEAIREFERARILIEEDIDPMLTQITQQRATSGMSILSDYQLGRINTQRTDMLARINRSYDFRTMYIKQRELDHLNALRNETRLVLTPITIDVEPPPPPPPPEPVSRPWSPNLQLDAAEIEHYITRFQQLGRKFENCLVHANQHFPTVTAILSTQGVPEDLAFLPLVGSCYNPSARSTSGEAGLWQFSKSRARLYDLQVDSSYDARFSIESSTRAFARYISDLKHRFGTWELAIIEYGNGKLSFLPQVIAGIKIARNPKGYGFDVDLYNIPPPQEVPIQGGSPQPLSVLTEPPVDTLY